MVSSFCRFFRGGRGALASLCVAWLGAAAASGATPPKQSPWSFSETLRLSSGWRDNLFYSPFQPLSRAFARTELEALAWRERTGSPWELVSYLDADVLRYFSPPPESAGEHHFTGYADARWQALRWLRLSAKAVGFYENAVVDLSETEAARFVAPTRVLGAYVAPTLRFGLAPRLALEVSTQAKRVDYRDYPGDFHNIRPGARLEWRANDALTLSATWFEHRRHYLTRARYTAGGRALAGTVLALWQREGELRADLERQLGGADWALTLAAGRLANRDRASGYFDYDQKHARLELGWERGPWHASFGGEAKRTDYLVQTVGAGLAPPPRIADGFELDGRLERTWREVWSVFLDGHWERERSNQIEFNYRTHTTQLGIERRF